VPVAIGDYLILKAVRDSGGTAVAVSDGNIQQAQRDMGAAMGIYPAPEGAATWAALEKLRASGYLEGTEEVVLFNTGMGIKYDSPIRSPGGRGLG